MNLPQGFFQEDPYHWSTNSDNRIVFANMKYIKVVNDHSERGIALTKEHIGILHESSRYESQFQLLMKVVEEHQKAHPYC